LTRNDLRELFGRHRSSEEIGTALRILGEHALVEFEKETTGGRPVERWFVSSEEARKARKSPERRGEVMTYRAYRAYRAPLAEPKHYA